MKKAVIFIFLSSLIFTSCEKDYSGIVDSSINEFQVIRVSPSGNVLFNAIDSLITIQIDFTQTSTVSEVSCDIYSSDNNRLNSSRIILYDNGNPDFGDDSLNDNKYANKFPLSSTYPIGNYSIRYYTTIITGDTKQIAQSNFIYDNGQENVAPVISNLMMVDSSSFSPIDSIQVDVSFIFSVTAIDSNGYNDILRVYFELYRPDSSVVTDASGNSKIQMFDDGNFTIYGDQNAGDGIFSFKNKFLDSPTTQRGYWRFEFRAEDRGGLVSNKIIKYLKVL